MGGRGQLSSGYTFRDKKELKTGLRKDGMTFIGKITNKQLPVTSYLGSEIARLNKRYGRSIVGLTVDTHNKIVSGKKPLSAINTNRGIVSVISNKAFSSRRMSKNKLTKIARETYTISYMVSMKRKPKEYIALKKKYGTTKDSDLYKKLVKEFK